MGQRALYEACAFGEALLKMGYPLIASLRGRLIAGALTQSPQSMITPRHRGSCGTAASS